MLPRAQGSLRLFRFAGIQVFLHWTWFVLVAYDLTTRSRAYLSPIWNLLEILALFLIVLMHEFGHALACRQVGGKADEIVLWPLGGVAYVAPPPRPGATLWSIAAGPLVNVALAPLLTLLMGATRWFGLEYTMPNLSNLIATIWMINLGLLVFNILPIYPLDGGQVLQCLLWFFVGRGRSMMVASVIGFAGVAGLFLLAWQAHSTWLAILGVFILINCRQGWVYGRAYTRLAKLPRRLGFACPACKQPPILGPVWRCGQCGRPFDMFATQATCPYCGAQAALVFCPECGTGRPSAEWNLAGVINI